MIILVGDFHRIWEDKTKYESRCSPYKTFLRTKTFIPIEMHGVLSGEKVLATGLGAADFELRGYGRKKGKGAKGERDEKIELSLEEAAFLLAAGKIVITKQDEKSSELPLEEFLTHVSDSFPNFGARYIVYTDLKERGYQVQPGGVDFWLYPRGAKPEPKHARYFIRIFSEKDFISVQDLEALLVLAHNMRKEPIIAVVDDESDITYYKVKEATFDVIEPRNEKEGEGVKARKGTVKAFWLGDKVMVWDEAVAQELHQNNFYGDITKEKKLLLSMVEAAYLTEKGLLDLHFDQLVEHAATIERDFMRKYAVYEDLRNKGLILKTGFKFGSHFRVYKALDQKHSLDLIHVLSREHVFSMPTLARAIRLAHGVKKRMIFAYQSTDKAEQTISYVYIGRMKL